MKRSQAVHLTLLAAAAATGCNSRQPNLRRCVDGNNMVLDENACRDDRQTGGTHGGGYYGRPHWYYGGPRGYVAPGARISGGSTAAPSASTSAAGTTRGVFGGAGASASGAHGAGGGE